MKRIKKISKVLFLILSCFLLLSSCNSPIVQQSDIPNEPPPYKEVHVKVKSDEEIAEELKKLHQLEPVKYKITSGDRFVLKVYNAPELNIPGTIVAPGGKVSIGLIGPVKIQGLTVTEANELINQKLSKYVKNPCAVLVPTDVRNASITIIGKVVRTGIYEIKSGYSLSDVVALAGGFAMGERDNDTIEVADLMHSYILRDNEVLPVDFIKAIRKGDLLNNIPVKDGDLIIIPSALDTQLFVFGEVRMPGTVPFLENQTIIQALSYAKGRIYETSSNDAIIVRGNLLRPKVYVVNTEDILQGRAPDFQLQPNDIVYVPKGLFTEWNLIVNQIMPTAELVNLLAGFYGGSSLSIPVIVPPP